LFRGVGGAESQAEAGFALADGGIADGGKEKTGLQEEAAEAEGFGFVANRKRNDGAGGFRDTALKDVGQIGEIRPETGAAVFSIRGGKPVADDFLSGVGESR
jgi:hypothetical protein